MEILYCDKCGIRIPNADLENGRATRNESGAVCGKCQAAASDRKPAARRSSAALLVAAGRGERRSEFNLKPARRSPEGGSARATAAPKAPGTSSTPLILLTVGAAVVVIGVGVVVLKSRTQTPPKPAKEAHAEPDKPSRAVRPPPAQPTVPVSSRPMPEPARSEPAQPEAPDVPEENLTDEKKAQLAFDRLFDGIAADDKEARIRALQAFVQQHPDSVVAARARTMLSGLGGEAPVAQSKEPAQPETPSADHDPAQGLFGVVRFGTGEADTTYFMPQAFSSFRKDKYVDWNTEQGGLISGSNPGYSYVAVEGDGFDFKVGQRIEIDLANRRQAPVSVSPALSLTKIDRPGHIKESKEDFKPFEPGEIGGGLTRTFTYVLTDADAGNKKLICIFPSWGVGERKGEAVVLKAIRIRAPSTAAAPVPPATKVRFAKLDRETKGNWKGVYGKDGHSLRGYFGKDGEGGATQGARNALPKYVTTLECREGTPYRWGAAEQQKAGLNAPDGAEERLGCDHTQNHASLTYRLGFSDAAPHRVTFYCVDPNPFARTQTIEALDPATGQALDAQSLENFELGAYLVYEVRGPVHIRITSKATDRNAVCSAIFFDPPEIQAVAANPQAAAGPWDKEEEDLDPSKPKKPLPGPPVEAAPPEEKHAEALKALEALVEAKKWDDVRDQAQALIGKQGPEALAPEQRAKVEAWQTQAHRHLAEDAIGKLVFASRPRRLAAGQYEFVYGFRSPLEATDFAQWGNRQGDIAAGTCELRGTTLHHDLPFRGDLYFAFDVNAGGRYAKRIVIRFYDFEGEFGAQDNKATSFWRKGQQDGWNNPFAKSDVTINPGAWHRVEVLHDSASATSLVRIDGKEALKWTKEGWPQAGPVIIGTQMTATFRNLVIRGTPDPDGALELHRRREFAKDLFQKLQEGQPVKIFTKDDEPGWHGGKSWVLKGDAVKGSGNLGMRGLNLAHYILEGEFRKVSGAGYVSVNLRANGKIAYQLILDKTAMIRTYRFGGVDSPSRVLKSLAVDVTQFVKFRIESRGKSVRIFLDGTEFYLLNNVEDDALGVFLSTYSAEGEARNLQITYLR